ncbi:FAD binding domain-containing protein [Xylogone sp. PMI_703]|nr:FAD binding domain-containing protein [Xylogone sp. PMI_703]
MSPTATRVEKFDVIVVGGGNAAITAALSAYEAGATVAVLEAAPEAARGGNSRFASAAFRIVHGGMKDIEPLLHPGEKHNIRRANLIPFTKERYAKEMLETSRGHCDREAMQVMFDQSYDTVRWMRDQGVKWKLALSKFFKEDEITEEVVDINPGLCLMAEGEGIGLMANLWAALEKSSITPFYSTPACGLIVDGDTVLGVRGRHRDGFIEFYGQVILGCGGFEASPRLRRQYLGEGWDLAKVRGCRYNTGTMIEKAIAAGAQATGHWGGCHAVPVDLHAPATGDLRLTDKTSRYSYPFGIMVNSEGHRFVNEGENTFELTYAAIGEKIAKQPGARAFQIFDQSTLKMLEPRYVTGTPVIDNTLKGLAKKLSVNPTQLAETVREYNAATPGGQLDPFHLDGLSTGDRLAIPKTNWAQPLTQPPYVAYEVTCGITFTYGGLKTDTTAHVLNDEGHQMPGLWAVGEISGGFFAFNYPGAAGLVKGAVFGRIAGREAAREALRRQHAQGDYVQTVSKL